ncbi:MAG: UxaA family hydrolase [Candidatus Competibacterales bacterium]|nr:UxaA family hydrolase [Candidatus Competibacterales bacterium]
MGLTASPLFPQPVSGYRRPDGRIGVRNHVVAMAAASNMNPVVRRLAAAVPGVTPLPAAYVRGQLGRDLEITLDAMAGLAAHPNVATCLVVGFEPESTERLAQRVRTRGREIRTLALLDAGGMTPTLARGQAILHELCEATAAQAREPLAPEQLLVGLECGGSDFTSGLVGNPALGAFTDALIDAGGSAIFSEPVECLGGEPLLVRRAATPEAARAIVATIRRYHDIALAQGVDLTGVNPTADNIAGGLSTIEEKSLGAIAKTGQRPIQGVISYGEPPPHRGLWLMEAPAEAVENLTALGAAGVQVLVFVTGSGNPVGHPLVPTVKVCANPDTATRMGEHLDVDLSNSLLGEFDTVEGGHRIGAVVAEVLNGRETAAERLGFVESMISRFGRSV